EDKECACQQTVGHSCNCEQRTEKRGHVADRSDRREEAVDRDVDRRVPIHSAITAWCEQPLLVRLIQLSEALCGTWPEACFGEHVCPLLLRDEFDRQFLLQCAAERYSNGSF